MPLIIGVDGQFYLAFLSCCALYVTTLLLDTFLCEKNSQVQVEIKVLKTCGTRRKKHATRMYALKCFHI